MKHVWTNNNNSLIYLSFGIHLVEIVHLAREFLPNRLKKKSGLPLSGLRAWVCCWHKIKIHCHWVFVTRTPSPACWLRVGECQWLRLCFKFGKFARHAEIESSKFLGIMLMPVTVIIDSESARDESCDSCQCHDVPLAVMSHSSESNN